MGGGTLALRHRFIGSAARLYWRLAGPRTLGVRAIVTDRDGRIALVRHTYADHWYLPGGGVKKGESFKAALLRELREEIAVVDARIERILGVYHSRREGKDDHVVVFVATVADQAGMAKADLREIEDARWFALDRLPAGTSPATLRRIAEYREGACGSDAW
jgi:ADP-ribose pyrophosphatase YjhB (NUDIX family)